LRLDHNWHFIPTGNAPAGFPRNGLTIKSMQSGQRQVAHELLETGLSQHGYLTATATMQLETILAADQEARRASGQIPPDAVVPVRDPERCFVSVFGTSAVKRTWGWRVEGHHISLQFTIVNGAVTLGTPSFFGSNPAEVREGPKKGLRVLGFEEDQARALLRALDAGQ